MDPVQVMVASMLVVASGLYVFAYILGCLDAWLFRRVLDATSSQCDREEDARMLGRAPFRFHVSGHRASYVGAPWLDDSESGQSSMGERIVRLGARSVLLVSHTCSHHQR